jgi:hypothetical protein
MQLLDRIEKRRFVGREFLLWLWFESEVFEGTLSLKGHGEIGLWIERSMVLGVAKESTRIKGAQPTFGREAKESLLRGKMPESAALHLTRADRESTFVLKADAMAVAGLTLPTVLDAEEEEAPALAPPRRRPRKRGEEGESDAMHEALYERMHLVHDFEAILTALYADFLVLRLGAAWGEVAAAIRAWAAGEEVDEDAYRAARERALSRRKR